MRGTAGAALLAAALVAGCGRHGDDAPALDANAGQVAVVDARHGFAERHRERYSMLLDELGRDGREVRIENRAIDDAVLADADLLVAIIPTVAYTGAEIVAITGFLERGGALLIVGGTGVLDALPMGIRLVSTKRGIYGPNWFPRVSDMPNHPVTRGVIDVTLDGGRALSVTNPAVVIGRTDPDTWLEPLAKGDRERSPDEPAGPFAVFAAATVGQGRVFYAGSNFLFFNPYVGSGKRGNLRLMRQSIRWLVEPRGDAHPDDA